MILVLSHCLKCAKVWEASSAPIGYSEKRIVDDDDDDDDDLLPATSKRLLVVMKTASFFLFFFFSFFIPLPPNRPFLFLTVKSIKELMLYLNLKLTNIVKTVLKKKGMGYFLVVFSPS